MTLTFWGHVTSPVTCPLDSQYVVYYRHGYWSIESYGIATKYVQCTPYTVVLFLFPISNFNWKSACRHISLNMFGPKRTFTTVRRGDFDELLGFLITQKWRDTEQSWPRKATSLACPLLDRINLNDQKSIPCAVTPCQGGQLKSTKKCCLGKARPTNGKKSKVRYEIIYADTDSCISDKFCGNLQSRTDQNDARFVTKRLAFFSFLQGPWVISPKIL